MTTSILNFFHPYIKIMRLNNWIKNFLIFLPLLSSHSFEISYWKNSLLIFFVFSLYASSMYVLNDFFDYEKDLLNSSKKKRPLTSGELSKKNALVFFFFLQLLVSSYLIFIQMEKLLLFCMIYNITSFLYSIRFKNFKFFDVFILGSFFVYRVFIGAEHNGLDISIWIVNFIFFLFTGLAFLKRYAEINSDFVSEKNMLKVRPYQSSDRSNTSFLSLISISISIILLVIYFSTEKIEFLYKNTYFLYIIPPVFFTYTLLLYDKIVTARVVEDPINYCIKLKSTWFFMILIILLVFLAK